MANRRYTGSINRQNRAIAQVAAGCILCLITAKVAAHDYWVERTTEGYSLFQGHLYSTHKGQERVSYDPSIVKRALCFKSVGTIAASETSRSYPVRVSGQCDVILFEISSGYWSQTLSETIQKPRSEVRGALRGWRSEEWVKRVDAWTPQLAKPLSDGLELTLTDDPFQLKAGDKLRLLVTWRGRPQSGVAVAYDGDARGVTGSDGRANLRIRHGGVQTLSASFEENIQDPQADKVVRGAILQLELPK